jgi:hypothetical protein
VLSKNWSGKSESEMELVLHYGMHKTGSSSIQDTLYELDSPDFTYINFGRPNPSLQITQGFSETWYKRPAFARLNLSAKDIEDKTARSRQAIIKQFRSIRSNRAIFSAEALAHLSLKELREFITLVKPFTSKIRAIGYVRSPKGYTESVFQQKLKNSRVQLDDLLVNISYKRLIGGLDELLGHSNVEVYKFDRSVLQGGCVVRDFCYRCGINIQDDDIISSNESLSKPAVQLLYMLWKYYPEFYRPHYSAIQTLFAKLLGRSLDASVNQSIIKNAVGQISQFSGMKMKLHSDAYRKIVNFDSSELDWLEKRTGITFNEDVYSDNAIGIKNEEDLMIVGSDTVRLLLEKLGMNPNKAPRLIQNHKLLAKHVHMLASR